MVLTQTQINARRRERYNAKKFNSKTDEIQKDESKTDEIEQVVKSETPEETKSEDIFETLYSHNYEPNDDIPTTINPMKPDIKPIEEPQEEATKKSTSLHRKDKLIDERTKKLFNRLQNRATEFIESSEDKPKVSKRIEKIVENTNSELKDKILLNHKIKQYKVLFPDELKNYKVSPSASVEKLKSHLQEIEILISLSSVDTFILDSIFYSIKMIEGISARTKNYNITGLADILKQNPEFLKLCKQLYLKYNTFEAVPPEYQLIMVVSTSAYICIQKNKNKAQMDDLLNQPYEGEI